MSESSRILRTGIIQQANSSDIEDNRRRIGEKIRRLASEGARLIVNQELHDSLYFCQSENVDFCDLAVTVPSAATDFYSALAKETSTVIVTSIFERRAPGLYHNTSIVYDSDGKVAGKYRKMHIPDDPGYYEKFYFTPGDLGFEPVDTSLGRLGVLVCWDQWYPEAARLMALKGAEILIYPTAIGWEPSDNHDEQMRQREAWITVQRGHAVANGLPVVTVNRVGIESDVSDESKKIHFWGSSFVVGPQGEFLYIAPEDKEIENVIDIDLNRSEQVRRWWPFLRDRRIDAYKGLTSRFLD